METLFLALRVLVALGAVLGLIWFVQRRMTRGSTKKAGLAGRFGGGSAPKRAISVLGSHRLGAKQSITVVEVDGVKLVLGVTEHGISVLEPQSPTATPVVVTIAAPDAIGSPTSDPTQVAASAEETLASADVPQPQPVDFAAVFREALDEAATMPGIATVTESVRETTEAQTEAADKPARRTRRVAVPALAEQLLPHMTKTLAAAVGIRYEPQATPAPEATPASPAPRRPYNSAITAFLENNAIPDEVPVATPATKDYSTAQPLFERLPVLQRAS